MGKAKEVVKLIVLLVLLLAAVVGIIHGGGYLLSKIPGIERFMGLSLLLRSIWLVLQIASQLLRKKKGQAGKIGETISIFALCFGLAGFMLGRACNLAELEYARSLLGE